MIRHLSWSVLTFGFLVSFVVWSVTWNLSDRVDSSLGLKGEATAFTFTAGGGQPVTEENSQDRLLAFLQERSLTLLVSSNGDGLPQIAVYNPGNRVAWLPSAVRRTAFDTYLFEGTYSNKRWAEDRVRPLVPAPLNIVGSAPRPEGIDRQQFAVVEPHGPLPGGRYLLSTTAAEDIEAFLELTSAAELAGQPSRSSSAVGSLVMDPLVILAVLMLVTGALATLVYWSILFAKLGVESRVRYLSGGPLNAMVSQYWRRFLPVVFVGTVAGCLASLLVVRAASGQWPPKAMSYTLFLFAGCAGVASIVALVVMLFVVIRRQIAAG